MSEITRGPPTHPNFSWTDAKLERLDVMWGEGKTKGIIAAELGCTPNAVVGKAHRRGLPGRPNPAKSAPAAAAPRRLEHPSNGLADLASVPKAASRPRHRPRGVIHAAPSAPAPAPEPAPAAVQASVFASMRSSPCRYPTWKTKGPAYWAAIHAGKGAPQCGEPAFPRDDGRGGHLPPVYCPEHSQITFIRRRIAL